MKTSIEAIQNSIDEVDREYFYSMRTFHDRVDRDEMRDRLEVQKKRVQRYDMSRVAAIASRRRELNVKG